MLIHVPNLGQYFIFQRFSDFRYQSGGIDEYHCVCAGTDFYCRDLQQYNAKSDVDSSCYGIMRQRLLGLYIIAELNQYRAGESGHC